MLSDTHYMERIDQECLKAHDALLAISDQQSELNLIAPCKDCNMTTAGMEKEYFTRMGLDVEIIYQRNHEFGSRALIYSYSDKLLCVINYHTYTDRYSYKGFNDSQIADALRAYMSDLE